MRATRGTGRGGARVALALAALAAAGVVEGTPAAAAAGDPGGVPVGAPGAAQDAVSPAAAPPPRDFVLSRPGRLARWTPVLRREVVVRAAPRSGARPVATLGRRTPEGTANLVLALARREAPGGPWVRVRLPILPNGRTGWVRRAHLGEYHVVRTHLIVDRARLTARLVRSGRTVFRARIGVGRPGSPTPAGSFYVRSRLRGFASPMYGPVAFGLSARSAVLTDWPGGGFIGVHGTNQPGLLPGRVSHGCIRMRNADVLRLARRMPVGTPVTIR